MKVDMGSQHFRNRKVARFTFHSGNTLLLILRGDKQPFSNVTSARSASIKAELAQNSMQLPT